jgi:formate hydrogenlyase subunit 3/multisubunit Na+/H+ antiporter MnhD subunit
MTEVAYEAWLILLPLAAATLAFLFTRGARWFFAGTVPAVLATLVLLSNEILQQGPRLHRIGGWGAPLGIEFHVDGLTLLLLWLTGVIIPFIGLYSAGLLGTGRREGLDSPFFWPLCLFFWGALNALFVSWDIFNIYVTLELLTLAAVPLIILARSPAALAAGMRYLLVALLGSLAYLLGVALVYADQGTLSLSLLAGAQLHGPAAWAGLALILLGLALKTALFPLHFWLPSAYAQAPSAVSALLSALGAKASFYLLLRLWFGLVPLALRPSIGLLLGLLGAAAVLWGSLLALRQARVKKLLAYSSIAQIGYLFFLFPLTASPGPEGAPWLQAAWGGMAFLLLAHACAKGAMFLAVGCMTQAVGSDLIADLTGAGRHLHLPLFAFALGGMTLMGLPPSGGFSSKWLYLNAALASGQWWWAPVMLAGGLLAAAYVFRVVRQMLVFMPVDVGFQPVPYAMQWGALLLALFSVLLGLSGSWPMLLLGPAVIGGGGP